MLALLTPLSAPAQLRTNLDTVLLPVNVTDRPCTPIAGLTNGPFVVLGGQHFPSQPLPSAPRTSRLPSASFFDTSGSMHAGLPTVKGLVHHLLTQMGEREVFLLAVSSQPEMLSAFTVAPPPWGAATDGACG
jgi:hypothetical protein